jgi:hypothetical protein
MITVPCWICGNPATTGEHRIKRSDLRGLFPKASQSAPLRLNSSTIKNRLVATLSGLGFDLERKQGTHVVIDRRAALDFSSALQPVACQTLDQAIDGP